ncbi:hypothetical protein HNQ69_001072 [Bartonella callosciuri]|uniref:Uncharacterized protein n=1 Tax=Bartonella callosciuri TaxID=686223 RepID=A0A840NXG2_9HYPH|nr:hypothetical protein [Bartonella callosciuri]
MAVADLQLMCGSTWSFTKSKYKDLHKSDSTASSLSSISLSDSTLVFNQNASKGYQILRIGSEQYGGAYYDKAYSAEGNVQIKLSAFLNNDGLFDPQKTDRILIYGDVSGTSVIHMQNFSKISKKNISDGGSQSNFNCSSFWNSTRRFF